MAMPISAEAKEDLKEMDLLPRKHIMADRSREKVRTQRTQEIVVPYMPNPAYPPKDLLAADKTQFPLYPYLQWLKTPGLLVL